MANICKPSHRGLVVEMASLLYHCYCAVAPAIGNRLVEIVHDAVRGITVTTN